MSQWPGTLNTNANSSRGRVLQKQPSMNDAQSKPKSKSPFRTLNTASYSEAGPSYSDLARYKLEGGKSSRHVSRDQRRETETDDTARMLKPTHTQNQLGRRVNLTEEDNYYGNFPNTNSYFNGDMSPGSSNMIVSMDDAASRGIPKVKKSRSKSREGIQFGEQNNGMQKGQDAQATNARLEGFMQNLQLKKRQISQEIENQFEMSPIYPNPSYPEDSNYKDENTLQLSNVRVEDILKRRGSPYYVTNEKSLLFEDEPMNQRDPFSEVTTVKSNSQPIFQENIAFMNRKSNLGSRIEEEEESVKRDGIHNSSFGDDSSLNPSFLKDEVPIARIPSRTGAGFSENPFQAKGYSNTELELELVRAKKESILLEDKLQTREKEMEELKTALEDAQREVMKMHELRERETKRMRQIEEDILHQKSINKSIELELGQTLQLQPLEDGSMTMEPLQPMESYQMIRVLKQDRGLLRRRVEEYEKELEIQKQRNENLRKELTETHDKELQKNPSNCNVEQILASYTQEIETLRMINQKTDKRAEELLREIETRQVRFEKDFEEERKKTLQVKKQMEVVMQEKEKVESQMREVQVQQKIKAAAFKVETEKIKEIVGELSKENQNYRKEIKVLSKNQSLKEKIDYLEAYYKQQLRNVIKENEDLQKKLKRLQEKYTNKAAQLEENEKSRACMTMEDASRDLEEETIGLRKKAGGRDSRNSREDQLDRKNSLDSPKETQLMREMAAQNEREITLLRGQLEETQNLIRRKIMDEERYIQEINKLKGLLQEMRSEKDALRGDIERKISEEYKEKLKVANQQVDNLKVENTILASKDNNAKVNEYKKQNGRHQEELKSLRKTMRQKLEEAEQENLVNKTNNDSLKRVVEEQEDIMRDYQDKMSREIQSLREEIQAYKKMLEEKQKEIGILNQEGYRRKTHNFGGNHNQDEDLDRETVDEELQRNKKIVEKQKEMLTKFTVELKECKEVIKEQEDHLIRIESERDTLQDRVKENDEEIPRYQDKVEALTLKMVELDDKEKERYKLNKVLKGK